MILVIISSADHKLRKAVKTAISETLGAPQEIISFNNNGGSTGNCKIYRIWT